MEKTNAALKVPVEEIHRKSMSIQKHMQMVKHNLKGMQRTVQGSESYWKSRANEIYIESYQGFSEEIFEIIKGWETHVRELNEMSGNDAYAENRAEEIKEELPDNIVV